MPTEPTKRDRPDDTHCARLAASIEPASWQDDGSFECRLYGGEEFRQYSWSLGTFFRRLSLDATAVDLARLNGGGLAMSIGHTDNDDPCGVIASSIAGTARVDSSGVYARFMASDDPEDMPMVQKMRKGILRNLSIEAELTGENAVTKGADGVEHHLWNRWQPTGLALVKTGASGTAAILSHEPGREPVNHKEAGMPTEKTPQELAAEKAEAEAEAKLAAAREEGKAAGQKAENDRRQAIDDTAAKLRLVGDPRVAKLIADGTTIEQARLALIDAAADRDKAAGIGGRHAVTMGEAPLDHVRAGITNLMLSQAPNAKVVLDDNGRRFVGLSLVEIGDAVCGRQPGGRTKAERVELAMSSSDFSGLLANVARKTLLDSYLGFPVTYQMLARKRNLPDFKTDSTLRVSKAPMLALKPEGAPVTYGRLYEQAQGWRIYSYEKGLAFTREMMINDDLGAFLDAANMLATSARWTEEVMFYAHVLGNPTMSYDSVALFHTASHGNLAGSGAVPSQTTIDAGFQAMSALVDIDTTTPIAVAPKFIVHSFRHRAATSKALGLWAPATESTQKLPYTEPLSMILSPAYTGNSWLMVADPALMPAFVYGYLAGSEGPRVSQTVDFDTNDLHVKVGIDWGCRAIEHRAVYQNPGA